MTRDGTRPDGFDAEKLIVLGRLASGIAHDFNNQLTSILGYTDLLLEELAEGSQTRQDLLEIRRAAQRAHLVTTHLVALSRPPRAAEPTIVSVAATVTSTLHLLKRILGEDIEIVTAIDRDSIDRAPDLVHADPSQLAHLLLCLGVLARQTLPHGGTLTIDTRNLSGPMDASAIEPSAIEARPSASSGSANETPTAPFVRIAVKASRPSEASGRSEASGASAPSDTSKACRADTDPPAPERSIAEAIVRLNGGDVRFERTLDGDTLTIVQLPRLGAGAPANAVGFQSMPPRGSEHVLIVEDDNGVRDVTRQVLERYGYTVLVSERPSHALDIATASPQPPIDLAIVDIVLPEQRGDLFARALTTRRPGVRVLFISGHSDEEAGAAVVDGRRFFLRKPFTPNELLIAVRQAIDSFPPPRGGRGSKD